MGKTERRQIVDRSILRHLGSSIPKSTPTRGRRTAHTQLSDMMQESLCRKHEHRFQHIWPLKLSDKINVGANNLLEVQFYCICLMQSVTHLLQIEFSLRSRLSVPW